jgi:hypothetical protein
MHRWPVDSTLNMLEWFADELKMIASPLSFRYQPSKKPEGCVT